MEIALLSLTSRAELRADIKAAAAKAPSSEERLRFLQNNNNLGQYLDPAMPDVDEDELPIWIFHDGLESADRLQQSVNFARRVLARMLLFLVAEGQKNPGERDALNHLRACLRFWAHPDLWPLISTDAFKDFQESRSFRNKVIAWSLLLRFPLLETAAREKLARILAAAFLPRVRRMAMVLHLREMFEDIDLPQQRTLLDQLVQAVYRENAEQIIEHHAHMFFLLERMTHISRRVTIEFWQKTEVFHRIDFRENAADQYLYQRLFSTLEYSVKDRHGEYVHGNLTRPQIRQTDSVFSGSTASLDSVPEPQNRRSVDVPGA
ncbi:hypothetical protein SISNIDRAFT_485205 [Sistotremastrum niveocremeum HHB9708]|uniref:Uncharacterized protein n=1 Tax=Sistotremastrum niveocremeum HHB9708 TaxID=1314777 RepID=A0A164VMI1_9AGAM|nr:hypothetical protein SISNIDRAFT_485205 [Sistotremastrum niveocremeum HHB9708]